MSKNSTQHGFLKVLQVHKEDCEHVIPGSGDEPVTLPYRLKSDEIDMDSVVINLNGITFDDEVEINQGFPDLVTGTASPTSEALP